MQHRLEKIKKLLAAKKLDAMLVSTVSNIFYLTDFSSFSSEEREAYLLITNNTQHIFTDARYKEAVEKEVKGFVLQLITAETPFVKLLEEICERENIVHVGFEENNITVWEHKRMTDSVKNLIPVNLHIRMQKDAEEIKKIQEACDMGDKAFEHVLTNIKRDVSEKQLATEIALFLKQQSADISFRPIIAFGANASMPHYESSPHRKLQTNECVLIDMGAKVNGYCSDMTRTVFFGKPSDEQRKIYETVLTSQQKAIDYINIQIKTEKTIQASDVDHASRAYIISQGYPSIPHSLGHGTGIDIHEPPSLNPRSEILLKPGMVFSLEPGIYIPDFCGVRIEDLVVLEETGVNILTLSPKELIVL